jgi:tetratricopeptide (TPR) repeat protein
MSGLEDQLRDALRVEEPPALDVDRFRRQVERRRGRRARGRALLVVAAAAVIVGAVVARRRSSSDRPPPMFAIEIVRRASAHEVPPDERLLRQAYARYQAHRDDEAQALLQRLLDEHPDSPHTAEAAVGRGDGCFEQGDFGCALDYYARVLPHEQSRVWRYALYKIGWAHENRGESEAAARAFARAIEGGDPGDPLVQAARADLARLRP